MTDEIFGPILPIVTVGSSTRQSHSSTRGPSRWRPTCSPRPRAVRERVIKEVSAGGMLVNHLVFHFATNKLPFGGVGPSGMGAYHGKFGFEEFSHRKSVMTKPTRPDLIGHDLPPVYREGVEAGAQAVLTLRFPIARIQKGNFSARSAGSRHRRHRSRRRTRPRVRADARQGGRQRRRQRPRRFARRHRRRTFDGRRGGRARSRKPAAARSPTTTASRMPTAPRTSSRPRSTSSARSTAW